MNTSTVFSSETLYSLIRVKGAFDDALRVAAMQSRETRATEPAPDSVPTNAPASGPTLAAAGSGVWTVPAPRGMTIPSEARR